MQHVFDILKLPEWITAIFNTLSLKNSKFRICTNKSNTSALKMHKLSTHLDYFPFTCLALSVAGHNYKTIPYLALSVAGHV